MDDQHSQPDIEIPEEIRAYLESVLTDAGMTGLEDEMHEEMIKELFARLDHFLTATLIDALPQEQLEPFMQLNEAGRPQEEVEAFLKEHIPNAEQVMGDAFMRFREMYLNGTTVGRAAQDEPSDGQPED